MSSLPNNFRCDVCSAPAPNHQHFGGKAKPWSLFLTETSLQQGPVTLVEHSLDAVFDVKPEPGLTNV